MSQRSGGWRTLLRAGALITVGLVVLGAVRGSHARIPVTLDNVTVFARPGQTVEGVVEEFGTPLIPKVRAVRDGRVVGRRERTRPIIRRNGVPVAPQTSVEWGDEIDVRVPPDVVEPSLTTTRAIDVAPRTIGRGVIAKTLVPGTTGVEQVTIGAVSGDVLATEVLMPPQAGLARLVPAAGSPLVALTFDDGPWPGQTEAILAILAERNVPATFFMLGSLVDRMPDVARAVVDAGHVVGNHTYRHTRLDATTPVTAEWEIRSTNWAIVRTTGARPRWLRAPGGRLGGSAEQYIADAGMLSALWTVDPQDWRKGQTSEEIAGSVVASVRPGGIVVLHDGGGDRSATIAALPVIIDRLRDAGYEFVTLDELTSVRSSW
ncbi:MAG: polysaccharide deacetylase family protein [Coriobacteriia bacterium]